jgi:predicted ATPase
MLRRLTVQGFKSLENTCVEFGPVTVLVGRSGTGKTNFVTALRFLRNYLFVGQYGLQEFGDWRQLIPATGQKTPMEFEVVFDVKGIEAPFEYLVRLHEQGLGAPVSEESLKLGEEWLFRQVEGKWHSEPQLVSVPQPGEPAIGRIPSISEVVIAYTALTTGIGCHYFPATALAARQGTTREISGLHDDADNYLQTLKEIVSNLQDLNVRRNIIAALQRLNPSISAVELDSIQNPTGVIVGHKVGEKTLSLSLGQESDGFRRFYAHLLALYQLPPKQTLVFEEPENGIYPGALSLLADEFKSAPAAGRGQIILTTHSPELLDCFAAGDIRVVVLDGFQTRIGEVSQEQKEAIREQLLHPGELLTVDPARIDESEPANA